MPISDREDIPHHLMNILDLHQEYRVTEFTKDALGIVWIKRFFVAVLLLLLLL